MQAIYTANTARSNRQPHAPVRTCPPPTRVAAITHRRSHRVKSHSTQPARYRHIPSRHRPASPSRFTSSHVSTPSASPAVVRCQAPCCGLCSRGALFTSLLPGLRCWPAARVRHAHISTAFSLCPVGQPPPPPSQPSPQRPSSAAPAALYHSSFGAPEPHVCPPRPRLRLPCHPVVTMPPRSLPRDAQP